jgi:hypothetical protein
MTSAHISGKIFKELPPSLTSLALHYISQISDDQIHNLPYSLASIEIQAANQITDQCGPKFPPDLRFLNLGCNQNVTSRLARYLCDDDGEAILTTFKFTATFHRGKLTYQPASD